LGEIFADVLDRAWDLYHGKGGHRVDDAPVVITGASLGLPGTDHIFDDANIGRILRGDQFIQPIPNRFRQLMLDKHITRLVKSDNGGPTFESIDGIADVIKLAARGNTFDLEKEFGVPADRMAALDRVTQLAIGAGIDALRDAGIPLVMRYKTTSKGTQLPDRWSLPDAMRDDTGIIFASAFPGYDSFADEMARYYADQSKRDRLAMLESLRTDLVAGNGNQPVLREIEKRINDLRSSIERVPYIFERRFLFKALSMGHSQFAEFIGARGPNTQINSACATTAQAITLAEDWIRAGRCSRVVIISSDDVTSDHMIEWIGAGFLASGAAATDEDVKEAAIPFDRRRHGMIIGMGAAALVVESAEAAKERGIRPICEVLSSVTANSAFHGTRLDVQHIGQVMEAVVKQAESRRGISRQGIAPKTVFVSHETYTPARGGSASAEIHALRKVFGDKADQIVIANTKGFTGHAMATGIEDVVAVKALETGCVPPVANFKEIDPELGALNLSKGGSYPVEYALHLGAGFGSQISMVLLRWTAAKNGKRTSPEKLGYSYRVIDQATWNSWLTRMAGHPVTNLEIVNRTLRVPDQRNISRAGETVLSSKPAVPVLSTENRKLDETVSVTSAAAETVASTLPVQVSAIPTAASGLSVEERILELVVEKTGYPKDMLDLDLDLEADLGVDTVKQAEVFAAIREIYNIPRDENRRLRDYPTLAHVIRFVHEKRPDLLEKTSHTTLAESVVSEVVVKTQSPPNAPALDGSVQERVLALVVEKTGYPREMLDLDLDLEADLGVDTVKQAEMFAAIREIYNIPRDENRKLRDYPTLTHVIRFVHESRPDLASAPSAPPAENDGKTTASAASPEQADPQGEDESVKERVLALVVEKTGYPKDMLDLDLDLEADLGVDTVKQAEMFAAIREIYNIPRDENRKLRDYPTLAHVIRFVHENRPGKAPAPVEVLMPAVLPAANEIPGVIADSEESIKERVLQIVAEKTGYPKDMLDLDLDLEADLGVDTVKQAEMFAAVRALYSIPRDENLKLRDFPTLAHVIKFARDRRQNPAAVSGGEVKTPMAPSASPLALASFEAANKVPRRVPVPTPRPPLEMCKKTNVTLTAGHRVIVMPDRSGVADALEQQLKLKDVDVLRLTETSAPDVLIDQIKTWIAAGPIQGVYWLPALDDEGTLVDMDVNAWRGAIWLRVKALYTTMRSLYEQIRTPETFLVSATRLGGQHGYDTAGATSPLGGGVTGFTKTYKRERMDALVKTVDFETTRKPTEVADILIAETLRDTGAVEIGYKSGLRWTIGLEEQSASDSKAGLALGRDTVFVVTGAAGSIVSAITADLAAVSGGKFYLLDLVPEPDANNPDLKRFVSDKEGLKRELFQRIQSRGERATPALVEKELSALERANAAQSAIDAVRNAGGTVRYFSVNLTDADSVSRVIDHVRKENRRIDVLLHAAGIERSHFLPDKDQREFDLVFDVKADGWFNLLHAIGNMPLGATVAFSSIAGRFGNAGQTDYSSANDLLCKTTSSFRRTRPETRGIVMDWTAWAGIGMATRGSIPKMMELAGIDMLPPEAGVPMIRRELTLGGTRGEILIGEKLGALLNEWDRSGGLDEDALLEKVARGPMLSKLVKMHRESGLTIETTIDPKVQPFLRDHQIDGTPVLPGVMGIEAFAEASQCILPGWNVQSIEDIDFLAPFKFYRNEPRQVTVETRFQVQEDAIFADCRLIGTRRLPNQKEQFTTHFTGHVRFTKAVPQLRTRVPIGTPKGSIIGASEIYHVYFHGPAYQVLERAWWNRDRVIGLYSETLPANHEPFELPTIVVPRLIELCFQTAGLWELGTTGKMGLPQHVDRIRLFGGKSSQQHPLYAMARPSTRDASLDIEIVDASGSCLMEVRGYRTVSAPGLVDLAHLNALQAAMSEVVMA
jgi:3-oxoacyl-(acyl-carrier-protein) synthase/NAD(P)-dependent dehydrogenase (short-subunit alcohol dehydrogenase family)